jgi:hypothetical protein
MFLFNLLLFDAPLQTFNQSTYINRDHGGYPIFNSGLSKSEYLTHLSAGKPINLPVRGPQELGADFS